MSWTVLGDFNEILNISEKIGGNPGNVGRMTEFGDCLIDYHLLGLGFSGPKFTWIPILKDLIGDWRTLIDFNYSLMVGSRTFHA